MSARNSLGQFGKCAIVEALEKRQLLSADLTAAFAGALPANFSLQKPNHIKILVTNAGDATATGPVNVALYASSDPTLDSSDTLLTPAITRTVRIGANKHFTQAFKFTTPTGLPDGGYYLLADMTPDSSIGDANSSNNVAASSTPVLYHAPYVDLNGVLVQASPGSVAIGGKRKVPVQAIVQVNNTGNIKASGPFVIDLYAATHPTVNATDTLLLQKSFSRLTLSPGKSHVYRLKDVPTATVPSGTFYIVAQINASGSIVESNTANDTAASPNVLNFTNPQIAPGPYVAGALTSSVSSVVENSPSSALFSIQIGRAGPSTDVILHEFDSSGNDLGPIATLFDDGNTTTNGDATAGDGIYTGMVTINSANVGSQYYAVVVSDSQLSALIESPTTSIAITPPPLPTLASALEPSLNRVLVGSPELTTFAVSVSNATASTTVEVEEFDANGNDLGEFTALHDDGSAADNDVTAGDGIFSGVNVVGFSDPGTRYFAAVVNDPSLASSLQTSSVEIDGMFAESEAQYAADGAADDAVLTAGNDVLAGGGSAKDAAAAVIAALASDPNFQAGSILSSGSEVEWTGANGIYYLYDGSVTSDGQAGGGSVPVTADVAKAAQTGTDVPAVREVPADVVDHTGSSALVLAPFSTNWVNDQSSQVDSLLKSAGYAVTYHDNATQGAVTLDDFKNFNQYDAIALSTHGELTPDGNVDIITGVHAISTDGLQHLGDLWSHRLILAAVGSTFNYYYAITPAWITQYDEGMDGTIVYAGTCDSLANPSMSNTLLRAGASAVIGYDWTVSQNFLGDNLVPTFETLLDTTKNTVGNIPGINSQYDQYTYSESGVTRSALFTEAGSLSATLPTSTTGELLSDYNVYVHYDWPNNVADLDTNTTFLGNSVGYDLSGGSYLNWSGDDRSDGGSETTTVDIYQAWLDGQFSYSTFVDVGADWFSPAGGSGPAYVTIGLQNKTMGNFTQLHYETIASPGQESYGATDTQYQINIRLVGDQADPTIQFSVT